MHVDSSTAGPNGPYSICLEFCRDAVVPELSRELPSLQPVDTVVALSLLLSRSCRARAAGVVGWLRVVCVRANGAARACAAIGGAIAGRGQPVHECVCCRPAKGAARAQPVATHLA